MSSSLRRGTLAATALTIAAVTLSACGAGNDAQSLQIKPDNAAATVGDIKVQNVNIVTTEGDSGPATVTGRVFNGGRSDQTLKGITVKGERLKLTPAKGESEVTVPAGGSVALGGKDNATALLDDAKKAGVRDGDATPVTFDLSRTGDVKLKATVVPATHQYKDLGPSVSPSGSPSGEASPDSSADESPSGKPQDQDSPSGEPGGESSPGGEGGGEHAGH